MKRKWFYLVLMSLFFYELCAAAEELSSHSGTYYGAATITSPAPLGSVDLAFYLDVAGSTIQRDSSFVLLDKTLLFPESNGKILTQFGVPVLTNGLSTPCTTDLDDLKICTSIGPRVSGTVSDLAFSLTIDPFENTVSKNAVSMGGPSLVDLKVVRSITLSEATLTDNGSTITGKYTEVVNGLDRDPVTIEGTFILVRPTSLNTTAQLEPNENNCIDLARIRAAGNDPNVMEFDDISAALHLYNRPELVPNICSPEDITQALNEYYGTLR